MTTTLRNDDALCREIGPELFFPKTGNRDRQAKAVCGRCPMQPACLDYALKFDVKGVWGGTNPPDRERIRAARGITAKPMMEDDAA